MSTLSHQIVLNLIEQVERKTNLLAENQELRYKLAKLQDESSEQLISNLRADLDWHKAELDRARERKGSAADQLMHPDPMERIANQANQIERLETEIRRVNEEANTTNTTITQAMEKKLAERDELIKDLRHQIELQVKARERRAKRSARKR